MTKIAIIGAGQVGAATTVRLVDLELAEELVLFDILEGMPQGKALDLLESTPVTGRGVHLTGTNDYADITGADIVVVTAGFPRKPGMDRHDLLAKNIAINKEVTANIVRHAPKAIILYVANPLDLMTYVSWKLSGFPPHRVFGMAGILDTTRFRTFVALELGLSVKDVQAMVLGGHGDTMVPLPRYCSVSGIPLTELLSKERIEAISERTRQGGGEIVKLLKSGSAFYAPGVAVAEMCQAIVRDEKRILPVCTHLNGQYGYKGVFVGVPAVLGRGGVEKVVELDLDEAERKLLDRSVASVREGIDEIEQKKLYA